MGGRRSWWLAVPLAGVMVASGSWAIGAQGGPPTSSTVPAAAVDSGPTSIPTAAAEVADPAPMAAPGTDPAAAGGSGTGTTANSAPQLHPVTNPKRKQPTQPDPLRAVVDDQPTGLPESGPGSAQRKGEAVGVVFQTTDTSAQTRKAIEAHGTIRAVVADPPSVTAWVQPEDVEVITRNPAVTQASLLTVPISHSEGGDVHASAGGCGPLKSEANAHLEAALASKTRGLDGTGLTIGILSDSFGRTSSPTSPAQDVASGALPGAGNPCGYPTPVQVITVGGIVQEYGGSGASDEGRAMAQLVHSVAPGARILFATAFNGMLSFADNIRALRAQGADVIVDDISYFAEPVFQDGPVSVAVSEVTAAGALYFSSAGNTNPMIAGEHVGSWETPAYRPTACPGSVSSVSCLDFDPTGAVDNTYQLTLASHQTGYLALGWSQPWGGVTEDLDLYLLNSSNQVVAASDSDSTLPCGDGVSWNCPFEIVSVGSSSSGSAQNFRVVVANATGASTPRVKLFWQRIGSTALTSLEYDESQAGDVVGSTIYGHNGGTAAISVAAVPYSSTTTPESFSSPGPVTLYWEPVAGPGPASALGSPEVLSRPDFGATDGDCTTFFYQSTGLGSTCPYRFFGTSAAAPNAGAVAALLLDANRSLTQEQLRTTLKSTANPLSGGSATWSGSGLIDALSAVGTVVAGAPGVPAGLSAGVGNGTVNLSWSAPASGSSALAGYRVQRSADGGQSWLTVVTSAQSSTATTAVDSSVVPGTSYLYRVLAINQTTKGLPSGTASVTTGPAPAVLTVPAAPGSVNAIRGGAGAVTVSWAAGSDGGSAVTGFIVTALPGGRTCTAVAVSCTVTGLTNGTAYRFQVVAVNGVGASAASPLSAALAPSGAAQKLKGKPAKKVMVRKKVKLPGKTTAGEKVTWTTSTPKVCKVSGAKVRGKKAGACKLVARAVGTTQVNPLAKAHKVKVTW